LRNIAVPVYNYNHTAEVCLDSKNGWKGFLELCTETRTPQELERLFDLFMSIEEKETLAARFLIIQALLRKKLSQREIAKTLGVSISQITRGSNALKMIDDDLKKLLKKG
jgi:TrpR family transcriptional regulator, trp operon repressor